MRKFTLLIAALAIAALPSVADAKKAKKHRAPKPAATAQQEMPGAPAGRVIGGFFREVSKVGQPPAPAKKGKKA